LFNKFKIIYKADRMGGISDCDRAKKRISMVGFELAPIDPLFRLWKLCILCVVEPRYQINTKQLVKTCLLRQASSSFSRCSHLGIGSSFFLDLPFRPFVGEPLGPSFSPSQHLMISFVWGRCSGRVHL